MHASIACLLLYEDYAWVSLGNAMKAKQSKASSMHKASSMPGTYSVGNSLIVSRMMCTALRTHHVQAAQVSGFTRLTFFDD